MTQSWQSYWDNGKMAQSWQPHGDNVEMAQSWQSWTVMRQWLDGAIMATIRRQWWGGTTMETILRQWRDNTIRWHSYGNHMEAMVKWHNHGNRTDTTTTILAQWGNGDACTWLYKVWQVTTHDLVGSMKYFDSAIWSIASFFYTNKLLLCTLHCTFKFRPRNIVKNTKSNSQSISCEVFTVAK